MQLKSAPVDDAIKRFLREKQVEVTDKTVHNYGSSLRSFSGFLEEKGITDMNDVDSDLISQYKIHRLEAVKTITVRQDMRVVRSFIEACERYQCVPKGLHELVTPPTVPEGDEINDTILTREESKDILEHLNRFEYASMRHTIVLILWKTGMRIGGLRALDVEDFDDARPALEVRHRPGTGTPLKRKRNSERDVIIREEAGEVIRDYIENNRPSVSDENGRNPLIATTYGRASRTTITRHVYRATSPCFYTDQCPVETVSSVEGCEYTNWNKSSTCPASVSPHALRRGYVTAARNAGQPKDVTGDRVNMSGEVLDKHYDHGTHDEKAERRKDFLSDI